MKEKLKLTYELYKEIEFHKDYMMKIKNEYWEKCYDYLKYFYLEDFCRIFRLDKNNPKSLPYIDKIQEILWIQWFYWPKYTK